MEIRSYDYARRRGVRFLSWEEVAHLSRKLGEALAQEQIEAIVGIARAGLFPATQVACALQLDLYPVRVSRRLQDEVRFSSPVWHGMCRWLQRWPANALPLSMRLPIAGRR